jgi:hypothetical protein
MSGSGGGSDSWRPEPMPVAPEATEINKGGGGGGGKVPASPCNIVETTSLNSVNRTVLSKLRTGSTLRVNLLQTRRLVAETEDKGEVAGSITSPSMAQLILCIQGGTEYIAEVLSVRGGLCQIQIRPK